MTSSKAPPAPSRLGRSSSPPASDRSHRTLLLTGRRGSRRACDSSCDTTTAGGRLTSSPSRSLASSVAFAALASRTLPLQPSHPNPSPHTPPVAPTPHHPSIHTPLPSHLACAGRRRPRPRRLAAQAAHVASRRDLRSPPRVDLVGCHQHVVMGGQRQDQRRGQQARPWPRGGWYDGPRSGRPLAPPTPAARARAGGRQ